MEPLASSNPKIKRLRRLVGRRSARLDEGAFVIEGPTNVSEAIRSGVELEACFADHRDLPLRWLENSVTPVAGGVLQQLLSTESPQPICAVAATTLHRPPADLADLARSRRAALLVCVDLADPGNAGTLLRSAEAAGAAGVVFAGRSVDAYNPKVVRSSAGSIFRVPFAVASDVDEVFRALDGLTTWASVGAGGTSHTAAALAPSPAILIGNEAHGLDAEVIERCAARVTIAMDGPTESLNAAMAGTVLLFEALRQRRRGA